MIGIYKITNTITNQCYIGQSNDIERRWMEHKTPKAKGNDRLHNDIQKYGVINFVFEVLEECEQSKLSERELHYIRKIKPYYNTIGRKVSKETRIKISNTLKEYWKTLPDDKRNSIIQNNLKGPKKGHEVSAKTRRKISKKISKIQKQKVRCIETGIVYDSVGDFEKAVGACGGTCGAYWKGKIKSVKGYHVEKV